MGLRFHLWNRSRPQVLFQGPGSWVLDLIFSIPGLGSLVPFLWWVLGIGCRVLPKGLSLGFHFLDMSFLKYIFCPPKQLFIAYIFIYLSYFLQYMLHPVSAEKEDVSHIWDLEELFLGHRCLADMPDREWIHCFSFAWVKYDILCWVRYDILYLVIFFLFFELLQNIFSNILKIEQRLSE